MTVSSFINVLQRQQKEYSPVVPFDPAHDRLLSLDLTDANKEITPDILSDTSVFTNYVMTKLKGEDARYGIGGYGEHRTIYKLSNVFDATGPDAEPRRLHLGVDIWGKPHTPVMAPLDGIVHSFAFNDQFGDYGATIILSHALNGYSFYTLYGHLSLSSIKDLTGGEKINKGDVFAEFGIPVENGHWPPHLHFQFIMDIGEWNGDYPGVCKFSEKEKWMINSPDPDIILQMNQYL